MDVPWASVDVGKRVSAVAKVAAAAAATDFLMVPRVHRNSQCNATMLMRRFDLCLVERNRGMAINRGYNGKRKKLRAMPPASTLFLVASPYQPPK